MLPSNMGRKCPKVKADQCLDFPALIRLPLPDPHACISEDSATSIRAQLLPRCLPLTAGLFSLVDAQDYPWAMQWRWQSIYPAKANTAYARRRQRKIRPLNRSLHREIAARILGRDAYALELVRHLDDSRAAELSLPVEMGGRRFEVSVVALDQRPTRAQLVEDLSTGVRGWRVLSRQIDELETQVAALKAQIGGAT